MLYRAKKPPAAVRLPAIRLVHRGMHLIQQSGCFAINGRFGLATVIHIATC